MDGKSLDTYSNLCFLGECETLKSLYRHGADMTVASERTGETILHCILAQQSEGDFFGCCKNAECPFAVEEFPAVEILAAVKKSFSKLLLSDFQVLKLLIF